MPIQLPISPDVLSRPSFPSNPPDLFGSFFQGADQSQKQALQNLFAGGFPKLPDGSPDYAKAGQMLLQTGGAAQLPNYLQLQGFEEQRKLPPITFPQPPPATPSPAPVSLNGPGGATATSAMAKADAADVGGDRMPPGQNTVQPNEVPNSAMVSVDGGPQEPLALAPTPKPDTRLPPQFSQTPDTGPATDRFRPQQVAQAQPAPQAPPPPQIPAAPTLQQGNQNEAMMNYHLNNARVWLEAARRAELTPGGGGKGLAETYRAAAAQEAAAAKDIREGIVKGQVKATETQIEQEKGIFDEAKKGLATANSGSYRLSLIDKSLKDLGPDWVGAGADKRAGAARAYNTIVGLIPGLPPDVRNEMMINPKAIATWEDFNKQSLNLGFELARTLGAREAMQIVQQATASVPNANQTYWGARLVSSAMRQAFKRQEDFGNYVAQQKARGYSVLNADVEFNRLNPVEKYVGAATSVVPPQQAIDALRASPTPERKAAFEKKYGDGALVGVFGAEAK